MQIGMWTFSVGVLIYAAEKGAEHNKKEQEIPKSYIHQL